MENKNILRKLNLIFQEVGEIKKDGLNKAFNYAYVTEAQLKRVLQPLLKKYGVIFKLDIVDQKVDFSGKMPLTLITIKYTFFDTESGESIEGTFCSQGSDSADKGIFKAITGAIKYILSSVFLIPTGGDPEEDEEDNKEKYKTYNRSYQHSQQNQQSHQPQNQQPQPQPQQQPQSQDNQGELRKVLLDEARELVLKVKDVDPQLYSKIISNRNPTIEDLKAYIQLMKNTLNKQSAPA
jgi:hypothetical protein